jgi:hypothetical protein
MCEFGSGICESAALPLAFEVPRAAIGQSYASLQALLVHNIAPSVMQLAGSSMNLCKMWRTRVSSQEACMRCAAAAATAIHALHLALHRLENEHFAGRGEIGPNSPCLSHCVADLLLSTCLPE